MNYKDQELKKMRRNNQEMRLAHRSNLDNAYQSLHVRNHSDYEKAKLRLK